MKIALAFASLLVPALALAAEELSPPPPTLLRLKDGTQLQGQVTGHDEKSTSMTLDNGTQVVVPNGQIVTPDPRNPFLSDDPARTRYFYAPSAFMLHRGEIVFAQRELLFSELSAGITDHFSVMAGGAVPLWFVNSAFNIDAGLKVGGDVAEWLHLAAGAETLVLPSFGSIGFGFGSMTWGPERLQLTVSGGVPFAIVSGSQSLGDVIIVVSGSFRVSEHFGFLTENWILPTAQIGTGDAPVVVAGGVRFMANNLAAEVGLLHVPSVSVPLPWVNFTYRWSSVW
jgi:hypothetical protein